jgi:predicted metal-dependent phosphoesterase TrpH
MPYVDLHLHSNHSDGSDTPTRVVERAAALGIAAIALTDHDTLSGVSEAKAAAESLGIQFLTGVEISTHFDRSEVHLLGLGIALDCAPLEEALQYLREARNSRAEDIIALLHEQGIGIELENVRSHTEGTAIGRMHIAQELLAMRVTKTTQEGFDRFLKYGTPAYVPKKTLHAEDAVSRIHDAGGMAFVAHPGLSKSVRKLLPKLLTLPFDGIEAYHVSHSPGRTAEFLAIAEERKLLVTGGSDCHGMAKRKPEMGKVQTPYAHFEKLQEALRATATEGA